MALLIYYCIFSILLLLFLLWQSLKFYFTTPDLKKKRLQFVLTIVVAIVFIVQVYIVWGIVSDFFL